MIAPLCVALDIAGDLGDGFIPRGDVTGHPSGTVVGLLPLEGGFSGSEPSELTSSNFPGMNWSLGFTLGGEAVPSGMLASMGRLIFSGPAPSGP